MIELLLALCLHAQEPTVPTQPLQFSVTHDGAGGEFVNGRLYVMLSLGKAPLIAGPNWFNVEPFFALDVENWEAGTPLIIDSNADAYVPIFDIPKGNWNAVAVLRKESNRSKINVTDGLYGEPVRFKGSGVTAGTIEINVNEVAPAREWKVHKNLRLDEKRSDLLSSFYGRDVNHGACVIVPDNYDPTRTEPYPVMYWIGGFGSDHYGGRFMKMMFTASDYDDQICRVILNSQAYTGHTVFANSENNGPRMDALIKEWIPYLEETYNLGGSEEKRFLAGHSSGGWAALWLQVQNPDFFGGAWALAPDPIDFHYFQTVDLYEDGANMYVDAQGIDRPIARMGQEPFLFTNKFVAMDDVLKDGGQIGSFEAVFSPKGQDGRPVHMFNRKTGAVNEEVVEFWKRYDIRKYLEDNWERIAPKLAGKINIVAGEFDTFYLESAVISIQEFFASKDFDALVRVMENGDHGSMVRGIMMREMDDSIAKKLQLPNIQRKAEKPRQ
jgi:hypothetical protein